MRALDAEEAEEHVDDTVILEDRFPEYGDRNRTTKDGRNIVNGSEHLNTLNLKVQDVCDEQGEDELQRNRHECIFKGCEKGCLNLCCFKNLFVIHESPAGDTLEELIICKAIYQRGKERICLEQAKADQPRNDKYEALVISPEFTLEKAGIFCFCHMIYPYSDKKTEHKVHARGTYLMPCPYLIMFFCGAGPYQSERIIFMPVLQRH